MWYCEKVLLKRDDAVGDCVMVTRHHIYSEALGADVLDMSRSMHGNAGLRVDAWTVGLSSACSYCPILVGSLLHRAVSTPQNSKSALRYLKWMAC